MNNYFSSLMLREKLWLKPYIACIKYTLAVCAMVLLTIKGGAQPNITRVEYYLDTDPGYGKATAISILPAADLPAVQLSYNFSALPGGVHILGVRSKDANGVWSLDNKWLFLRPYAQTKAAVTSPLTRVEYYIDNDPGYGSGTALTITKSTSLPSVALGLDLTPFTSGVHIVGIRSQDSTGKWSLDNKWLFVKPYTNTPAAVAPKIARLEYYLDTDPGYGNGTPLAISSSSDIINFQLPLNFTALAGGVHIVGIRSQDVNGVWSFDNKWLFLRPYTQTKAAVTPKITYVEYYIDNDPGFGKAVSLPVSPATTISSLPFTINMAPLAGGIHIVGIRSQDSLGQWSFDNKWLFLKNTATALVQPAITKVEYYIDADPGYGKATAVGITTGQDIADLSFPISISTLSNGPHFIGIRSKDANGAWCLDNKYAFTKTQPAGLLGNMKKLAPETLTPNLALQYNPVHNQAILLYTATQNDKIAITVVDNAGRIAATKQVNVYMGVNPITIETAAFAQGVYYVQTTSEKNTMSVKMLKQ